MKTVIQTRVDSALREDATNILASMGMSLNDGIRIFLQQVVNERAFPFRPVASEEPTEYLKECIAQVERREGLISFDSTEEFSKWLDSGIEE